MSVIEKDVTAFFTMVIEIHKLMTSRNGRIAKLVLKNSCGKTALSVLKSGGGFMIFKLIYDNMIYLSAMLLSRYDIIRKREQAFLYAFGIMYATIIVVFISKRPKKEHLDKCFAR